MLSVTVYPLTWRVFRYQLLRFLLTCLVGLGAYSPASSAQSSSVAKPTRVKQRLAVLELNNRAQLTGEESKYLTDLLRRTTSELLRDKLAVMTRENIQVMLPPDRTLEECVGECEVQTGQLLGAHYIITGSIIKFGQFFRVTIKLHDTQSGELMGTEVAGAGDLLALEQQIQVKGQALIRKILSGSPLAPQGTIKRRSLTEESTSLTQYGGGERLIVELRSDPPSAGISIDGSQRCSEGEEVCRVEISSGAHDVAMALKDYFTKRASVTFGKSEVQKVTWTLEPNFVHLEVIPTPSTLKYQINGTQYRGPQVKRAKPNALYKVVTNDPCYTRAGEEVSAPLGERVIVKLAPKRQRSLLDVSAVGSRGEPLEISVRVDGGGAHITPARFEVDTCSRSITTTHAELPSRSERLSLKAGAMKRLVLRFDTDRKGRERRKAQESIAKQRREQRAREETERRASSDNLLKLYRNKKLLTWVNVQSGVYSYDKLSSDLTPYYGLGCGFELHLDSFFLIGRALGAKGFSRGGQIGVLFDTAYVLFPFSLGAGSCWGRSCLSLSFDFGSFLNDNARIFEESDTEGELDDNGDHLFVPTTDPNQVGVLGYIPISLRYSFLMSRGPTFAKVTESGWRLVIEATGVPFNKPYRWFPTPEPGLYPTQSTGLIPIFIGAGFEYAFLL